MGLPTPVIKTSRAPSWELFPAHIDLVETMTLKVEITSQGWGEKMGLWQVWEIKFLKNRVWQYAGNQSVRQLLFYQHIQPAMILFLILFLFLFFVLCSGEWADLLGGKAQKEHAWWQGMEQRLTYRTHVCCWVILLILDILEKVTQIGKSEWR